MGVAGKVKLSSSSNGRALFRAGFTGMKVTARTASTGACDAVALYLRMCVGSGFARLERLKQPYHPAAPNRTSSFPRRMKPAQ